MKPLSRTGMALLFVMAMIAFASCDTNGDTYVGSGVDFTNHPASNAAFFVDNGTGERLVAFAGSISMENLLGGIPAWSRNHGIRRNPDIFNQTRAFTMILVTEEQFVANRNNLSVLAATPFARIFVFYRHDSSIAPERYIINEEMVGGRNSLVVQNQTGFGVELRVGGPSGPTIGFVPAEIATATINVADGDISVFPVFVIIDLVFYRRITIYPRLPDGSPWFAAFSFSGGYAQTLTLDSSLAPNISLGWAGMSIENHSMNAVQVSHEGTIIFDAMGFSFINPGSQMTIPILMALTPSGTAESQVVSGFRVGVVGLTVPITDAAGNDTFTLLSDMRYTVTVTGSLLEGLTATIDLENAMPISIHDIQQGN